MATTKTTTSSTCEPPIPYEALEELSRRLGSASIKGWDECPPQIRPPHPTVKGAWFDVTAVVKVYKALSALRHTKTRRWKGKPLTPDPWQLVWVIAPVFGWKHSLVHRDKELAGTRIIRTLYVEVPRKNGKSTLSSGLALVLLCADGEWGAEVYAAATTRTQAGIVFGESKKMAQAAPLLKGKLQCLGGLIRVPRTGSIFRVLSKIADAAHGLNVSGAVIDELHVHRNRELVDAIETGTGGRDQPLIIIITTADEGEIGTIYEEKHDRAHKCAKRIIKDPTYWGVIWAADEADDPFAESTWKKCNPGYGRTVTKAYIKKEAAKAKDTPSYFPTYCRLHLNRRIRQTSRFLNIRDWDAKPNVQTIDVEALRGRECYGGLDLSATTDLTAFGLIFPYADHTTVETVTKFWLPEDDLDDRVKRDQTPYDQWAKAGWLTLTEGNVVDYSRVIDVIEWARTTFDLRSIGHDRWQAGAVVQHLALMGIEVYPIHQTYQGMSAATKELERLVKQGRFKHGGNPILRAHADAVEVMRDNADNVRPVKPDRQKSSHRVDGITANVMALDAWLRRPEKADSAWAPPTTPPDNGSSVFRPSQRLAI